MNKAEEFLNDETVWPLGAGRKARRCVEGFAEWLKYKYPERVGNYTEQEYINAGKPSDYTWNPYIRMWMRQSGPCLNCGWQPGDNLPADAQYTSALGKIDVP